jgi:regulatory protein
VGDDPYELALRALSQKERTVAELTEWLRERWVTEEDVQAVIERLAADGVLNDERFARRFAEDKRELRQWGPERIADSLRARGVEDSEIEAAVSAEEGEEIVVRAVGVLAEIGAEPIDDRSRARALSLLTRRGYPLEVAYDAVRTYERNG